MKQLLITPGQRADVLVQAGIPGSYELTAKSAELSSEADATAGGSSAATSVASVRANAKSRRVGSAGAVWSIIPSSATKARRNSAEMPARTAAALPM